MRYVAELSCWVSDAEQHARDGLQRRLALLAAVQAGERRVLHQLSFIGVEVLPAATLTGVPSKHGQQRA